MNRRDFITTHAKHSNLKRLHRHHLSKRELAVQKLNTLEKNLSGHSRAVVHRPVTLAEPSLCPQRQHHCRLLHAVHLCCSAEGQQHLRARHRHRFPNQNVSRYVLREENFCPISPHHLKLFLQGNMLKTTHLSHPVV